MLSLRRAGRRRLPSMLILFPLIALLGLLVAPARPAFAAAITVTTTDDELNSDGDCSLREAIQAADTDAAVDACGAGSGADTISVPAGTYNLTMGELAVVSDLTISGAGAATTVIDAGSASRVLNVSGGSLTVQLSGMTLQDGSTNSSGAGILNNTALTLTDAVVTGNTAVGTNGGGIFNSGALTLTNTTVSDNSATGFGSGGGIYNACCSSTATLTDTTVTGNSATGGSAGGIFNQADLTLTNTDVTGNSAALAGGIWNITTLTITNGTVGTNTSVGGGGGIFNQGTFSADGTAISDNTATGTGGVGGGIYNEGSGSATVANGTISGNSAASGGGIFGHAPLSLTNTTVSGNTGGGIDSRGTATIDGGTISGNDGEGVHSEGTLTITNGAISNNTAAGVGILAGPSSTVTTSLDGVTVTGNAGPFGGGISNGTFSPPDGGRSDLTISNSTISGNTSGGDGGGIDNFAEAGTLTIDSSTISGNSAPGGSGGGMANVGESILTNSTISGNTAMVNGGAIQNRNGTMTIGSSTLTGNSAGSPAGGIVNDGGTVNLGGSILANSVNGDCSGAITSAGYNLIEDPAGCTISGDLTGNIAGMDPKLGPLADYGGPTFTHELLLGSPARNAGDPACPPPATDQRGVGRPQGPECDIGSFEQVGILGVAADGTGTILASGKVAVSGTIGCGTPDVWILALTLKQRSTRTIGTRTVKGSCTDALEPWAAEIPPGPGTSGFADGAATLCFHVNTRDPVGNRTDRTKSVCEAVTLHTGP